MSGSFGSILRADILYIGQSDGWSLTIFLALRALRCWRFRSNAAGDLAGMVHATGGLKPSRSRYVCESLS